MNSNRQYHKLFEPGRIGQMTTRNRMVMAPMATNFHSIEGFVTQRTKDYYEARAKGGIGLIIVEATTIDSPEGRGFNNQLVIDDDKYILGMSELTEVIHRQGARVALQLHHIGPRGNSRVTGRQIVAASPVAYPDGEMPRALEEAEIARLVTCYAQAARRAKEAGFDGVEVHSAHGYLLAAFLNPDLNKRQDRYGGAEENRIRFLMEIFEAIRHEVGRDYPLWCRIGGNVAVEYSPIIEKAGADAIHISVPGYAGAPDLSIPPMGQSIGELIPVAAEVKKVVAVPVITASRIVPDIAESAIREGKADYIAFGRPLLADAEFTNKVASGELDDIKPCIRCNTCLYSVVTNRAGIHCAVNPVLGRERDFSIIKATKRRKVLVIGGGPAGMEAARVAALRGHKVKLYEKGKQLGGQLLMAQLPRYKETIGDLVTYLSRQMDKQGIDVHLSREVDADLIAEEAPDAVVLATGGFPFVPGIPGIDRGNVVLATDVLTGKTAIGDKVVIIGGELVGCEVGDMLAETGKKVTITTLESDLLTFDVIYPARMSLLLRLRNNGVGMLTGVKYKEITDDGIVLVDKEGGEKTIKADNIVVAAGTRPNDRLVHLLKDKVAELYCVGDCVEPHNILNAMKAGYEAGLSI